MVGKFELKRNDLYIILIALVAIQDAFNASSILNPVFKVVKYPLLGIILCLMAFLILKSEEYVKSLMVFGVFLILGIHTSRILSTNAVLYIVILCYLSRNCDMLKAAKVVLGVIGSVFILHLCVFLFNYIFSKGTLPYLDWNGLARYYIYYDHPNNAAKYFVFICTLAEYVYSEKLKLHHWVCIFVLMMMLYFFTHSEGVFVVAILFVLSTLRNKSWMKKCTDFFAQYGMIIVSIVSTCFAYAISIPGISGVVLLLDTVGSGRFSGMFRAVEKYGPTLLGQEAIFGNNTIVGGYFGIYADNLTVYCITCLGIIYILTLCFLFYLAAKKIDAEGKIYLCVFIILSFFENRMMTVEAYFAVIIAVNAIAAKPKYREFYREPQKS